MKLDTNGLRKAYIINTLLVIAVFILDIIGIFKKDTLNTDKGAFASSMVAISFGLYYLVNSYKKNAAENYRYFLLFYGFNILIQLYGDLYYLAIFGEEILVTASATAFSLVFMLVMLALLLVSKDLGYKVSSSFSYIILIFSIINLIIACVSFADSSSYILLTVNHVVMSCVTCMFVIAKYNDKALRNSK